MSFSLKDLAPITERLDKLIEVLTHPKAQEHRIIHEPPPPQKETTNNHETLTPTKPETKQLDKKGEPAHVETGNNGAGFVGDGRPLTPGEEGIVHAAMSLPEGFNLQQLALKAGRSYSAVSIACSDIKKKTGVNYHQPEFRRLLDHQRQLPPASLPRPSVQQPPVSVQPESPKKDDAIEIGRQLREPFSVTDLEARLEPLNGLSSGTRARHILARWKADGWITTASFGFYTRSPKFGGKQ